MLGRPCWQRGTNLSGLNLGQHGKRLDLLLIISDPIDDDPAVLPELFWGHVETFLFGHRTSHVKPNYLAAGRTADSKRHHVSVIAADRA
jgi:hypothetical protein